jgi:transposase-like protein
MRKKRHNYTPEEKVFILKRHLVERVPVSDLCDEYQLQPKIFYTWQQQFFENGTAAFPRDNNRQQRFEEQRIQQLEEKLRRKHEVLSELMEEHVKLKKELGELCPASGFPMTPATPSLILAKPGARRPKSR